MGKNKSTLWGLLVPNMTMVASFSNRCLYYQSDDKLGVVSFTKQSAPFLQLCQKLYRFWGVPQQKELFNIHVSYQSRFQLMVASL